MTFLIVAIAMLTLLTIGCALTHLDTPGSPLARFLDVLFPPVHDQEK